jgi:hypothetical protein
MWHEKIKPNISGKNYIFVLNIAVNITSKNSSYLEENNLVCQPILTLEPIIRLFNLQLQRQRCSKLERFYIGENKFCSKNALCYLLRCKFLQRWHCNS